MILSVRRAVALLLLSSPALAQTEQQNVALEERARSRVITVLVRIEPTNRAEYGECLILDEDALIVTVRGKRVAPERITLDRKRKPTVHALLVDTSGSMRNDIGYVREAAAEYVRALHPDYEKAFVATFDDSVVLHQAVTSDREELARAAEGIRIGGSTAMNDALHYAILELATYRERPVILILTDGWDTASIHDRVDALADSELRSDLTIFTIGFNLPEVGRSGGARKFLQQMAAKTQGQYFDPPVGSRISKTYRRIREILDNEATLTVLDPDPDAKPGKLRVRTKDSACKIRVFHPREATDDPMLRPIPPPWPDPPQSMRIDPETRFGRYWLDRDDHQADPECRGTTLVPVDAIDPRVEDLWTLEVWRNSIRGCALDLTMDPGMLYDAVEFWDSNTWLKFKTRSFDIPVRQRSELPKHPWDLMDSLANRALDDRDLELETDSRKVPVELHARPFHGHPEIWNGRMFFAYRHRIAHALFLHEDYREWVLGKLQEEADKELENLRERLREAAPRASPEVIERAMALSDEAQRIRDRAAEPCEADLTRYLASWLGDVSAYELFVRWEAERINRWLAEPGRPTDSDKFSREWRAIRKLMFVPSYARILTLMEPIEDLQRDRIGFWRVVLPQPSWIRLRPMKNAVHPEMDDLPLDLVPDLPYAHWTAERVAERHPEVIRHVRREGYRLQSIDYELLTRESAREPQRAFCMARVSLFLQPEGKASQDEVSMRLAVHADVHLDALRSCRNVDGKTPIIELIAKLEKNRKRDERSMEQKIPRPTISSIRFDSEGDPVLASLAAGIQAPEE